VLVTACPEGLGYHGLFPFLNGPRFERQIHQLHRLSVLRPGALPGKVKRKAGRVISRIMSDRPRIRAVAEQAGGRTPAANPIWLHVPDMRPGLLPEDIPGLRLQPAWEGILGAVGAEQEDKRRVRVVVYPCAALQCLQWQGDERTAYLTESVAG